MLDFLSEWSFQLNLLSLLGIFILGQVAVYRLAKKGKFGFKFRKEGTAELVFENGEFNNELILALSGYRCIGKLEEGAPEDTDNLNVFDIVHSPNSEATRKTNAWLLNIFFPVYRVVWVGWPGICTIGREISVKEEVCDLVFTKSELANKIPYNIKVRLRRQVTNAAKAALRVEDYDMTSLDWMHDQLDMEFRSLSEEDFKANKDGKSGPLDDVFKRALDASAIELTKQYGVTFHGIKISEIDPIEELREVTLRKTVAQIDVDVKKAKEIGEAEIAKIKAASEAEVLATSTAAKAKSMGVINKAAGKMCDNAMRLEEQRTIREATATLTLINGLNLPSAVLTIPTNQKGSIK